MNAKAAVITSLFNDESYLAALNAGTAVIAPWTNLDNEIVLTTARIEMWQKLITDPDALIKWWDSLSGHTQSLIIYGPDV